IGCPVVLGLCFCDCSPPDPELGVPAVCSIPLSFFRTQGPMHDSVAGGTGKISSLRPKEVKMLREHQLWEEIHDDGTVELSFGLTQADRDRPPEGMGPEVKLIWTVEAESYNEAMTKYNEYMAWGEYKPLDDEGWEPYPDEQK